MTVVCRHAEDVVRLVPGRHRGRVAGGAAPTIAAGTTRAAMRLVGDVDRELRRATPAIAPHARVPVRSGRGAADADLLCADHRIAVEIGGWQCSRAAERHRRDCGEDEAPGEKGCLVLGRLAKDVTDNPAAIAAKIRVAERDRLRSGRHLGGSP